MLSPTSRVASVNGRHELFSVSRATVYRVLERHQSAVTPSTPGGQ